MRAVFFVCALLGVAHAEDDADERFAAAIEQEARDPARAATTLRALGRGTEAVAPDALAEACTLYDQRLFDLPGALTCWKELVLRFPDSRASGRAHTRIAALAIVEAVAPADRAALVEFETVVAGTPDPAQRAHVRTLLAAHRALPIASRAHAWLAQADGRAGELDDALAEDELAQAGGGEWAARALRDEAALLVRRGRLDDAAAAYDRLALIDEPVSRLAVARGRHTLTIAHALRVVRFFAWAWLALYIGLALALVRRSPWPPPVEVKFLAPVALLFIAGAALEPRNVLVTVAIIAVGSVAIVWPAGTARRLALGLAAPVAVLALAFLAVQGNDLVTLVAETLRAGPER